MGESGSGKSVFTKSFMGLLDSNGSITSGTIDYFGADDHQPIRLSELKKEKDWLKVRGHEIAMIMQDPMTSLNPLKTIGDQIMEPWSSIRASRALPPGRRPLSTCGMSHRRPGGALQAVSPRVLGRYAPARRHRHRCGLQPRRS